MMKVYWVKPIKIKADRLATSTKVQITGKLNADKSSGIPPTTLLFDLDASPVVLGSGDQFQLPSLHGCKRSRGFHRQFHDHEIWRDVVDRRPGVRDSIYAKPERDRRKL